MYDKLKNINLSPDGRCYNYFSGFNTLSRPYQFPPFDFHNSIIMILRILFLIQTLPLLLWLRKSCANSYLISFSSYSWYLHLQLQLFFFLHTIITFHTIISFHSLYINFISLLKFVSCLMMSSQRLLLKSFIASIY